MNTINKKLLLIPAMLVFLAVLVSASSVQTALFYESTNSNTLQIMNGQNVGITVDANSILESNIYLKVDLLDSAGNHLSNLLEAYTTDSSYSNHFFFGQGTYFNPGNYIIQSTVIGASRQTATARLYLQVLSVIPPNQVPVITSTPVTQINATQTYSYQVIATDADGDPLAYTFTQAPTWLSMNSTGFVSGVAPNVTSDYQYLVTVQVSDGKSFVTQTYPLVVKSGNTSNPPVNSPPTITSSPVTQVNESSSYNYQVNAVDPDGDSLTYSLAQNPTWLSINPSTGLISGTAPNVTQNTNYFITVAVSDGVNALVSQTYVLTVLNIPVIPPTNNTAPVITSTPITQVNETQAYSYQVTATDADNDTLSYSFSGPSWLSMNPSIGLLSGTAPSVSSDTNYLVAVSVSDGINTPVTQTYLLTVVNVPIIIPPNPTGGSAGGAGTRAGNVAKPDLSFETQQYFNQFAPKSVVAEEQGPTTQQGSSFLGIILIILGIILVGLLIFFLINWLGWGMNIFWIIIGILVIALLIWLIFF